MQDLFFPDKKKFIDFFIIFFFFRHIQMTLVGIHWPKNILSVALQASVFGKGRDMKTMAHSDLKCLIGKYLIETMSHYILNTWRHFHVYWMPKREWSHWKFCKRNIVSSRENPSWSLQAFLFTNLQGVSSHMMVKIVGQRSRSNPHVQQEY